MSSSGDSTKGHTTGSHGGCRMSKSGNWSCFNIAAMVLGFIVFWPLGLFILFWNISGRSVKELPGSVRQTWSNLTNGWGGDTSFHRADSSDNDVFNEYQQTQYDRIHEIKEEIKTRSTRFKNFRKDAKRRADQEEFNRFMSDTPEATDQ